MIFSRGRRVNNKAEKKMLARHFAPLQIPALRAITSQGYEPIHWYTSTPTPSSPSTRVQSGALPAGPQSITQQQAPRSCMGSYICFCLAQRLKPLPLLLPKAKGRAMKETERHLLQPPEAMPLTQFKAKVRGQWARGGNQKSLKAASRVRNL